MISVFKRKQDCCGCTACKNICPQGAINMYPDNEGFVYPSINQTLCTDCGLCKKVCAFQNGYDTSRNLVKPNVYALKHMSNEVRNISTSGGAFTAMSDMILLKNGVIYGAGFTDDFRVTHQRAETTTERDNLRGSKYVQSDMGFVFCQVSEDLANGRYVLFSGTGCQVAGLRSYLQSIRTNTENLLTVDIICRGTPSPQLFSDYITFLEKKGKSKIISFNFRSKVKGWKHTEEVIYENGKKDHTSIHSQLYKALFNSNMCFRPSCYQCRYTNTKRPGDITLGDFWGIGNYFPDFYDNLGISAVIVNTEKGAAAYQEVNGTEDIMSSIEDCAKRQAHLHHPSKLNPKRQAFWDAYTKHGFEYAIKKYTKYGSLKFKLKRILKK